MLTLGHNASEEGLVVDNQMGEGRGGDGEAALNTSRRVWQAAAKKQRFC